MYCIHQYRYMFRKTEDWYWLMARPKWQYKRRCTHNPRGYEARSQIHFCWNVYSNSRRSWSENQQDFFSQDFDSYCGQFGAVLDLMDVHSVARVGFSTSVLEMVQEMGRCGRGRTNSTSNVTDNVIWSYHVMISFTLTSIYINHLRFLVKV